MRHKPLSINMEPSLPWQPFLRQEAKVWQRGGIQHLVTMATNSDGAITASGEFGEDAMADMAYLMGFNGTIKYIHGYFSNFEPRRCCLLLTSGQSDPPSMRLVQSNNNGNRHSTIYPEPQDPQPLLTSLTATEFQVFRAALLAVHFPVLSAPPPPRDITPTSPTSPLTYPQQHTAITPAYPQQHTTTTAAYPQQHTSSRSNSRRRSVNQPENAISAQKEGNPNANSPAITLVQKSTSPISGNATQSQTSPNISKAPSPLVQSLSISTQSQPTSPQSLISSSQANKPTLTLHLPSDPSRRPLCDPDDLSIIPAETMADTIRRAFRLSKQTAFQLEKLVYEPFKKKSNAKILAEELVTQLSQLENNTNPYCNSASFMSVSDYKVWQRSQRSQILDRMERFWHLSLPALSGTATLAATGGSGNYNHHAAYRYLARKLIRYETHQKSGAVPPIPPLPLSGAVQRILVETALRYGIGDLYCDIVHLEYLSEVYSLDPWYLTHTTARTTRILDQVARVKVIGTKDEIRRLSLCCEVLLSHGQKTLSQCIQLVQDSACVETLGDVIELLHNVLRLKNLLPGGSTDPDAALSDMVSQGATASLRNLYNSQKKSIQRFLSKSSPHSTITPKMLNSLMTFIKDCQSNFKNNFESIFSRFLSVPVFTADVLYQLLMGDVAVFCASHNTSQVSEEIDLTVVSLAYRLHQLDREWAVYITPSMQSWRQCYGVFIDLILQTLHKHVTSLVLQAVANDKFLPTTVPKSPSPHNHLDDTEACHHDNRSSSSASRLSNKSSASSLTHSSSSPFQPFTRGGVSTTRTAAVPINNPICCDNVLNQNELPQDQVRVSSSAFDLVVIVQRLIHLQNLLCLHLYPTDTGCNGDENSYSSSLSEKRSELITAFTKLIRYTLEIYANNMTAMDLCALPLNTARDIFGEQFLERLWQDKADCHVWGCRHMAEQLPKCQPEKEIKSAKYLADCFTPVDQKMCVRINNVLELSHLVPDFTVQLTASVPEKSPDRGPLHHITDPHLIKPRKLLENLVLQDEMHSPVKSKTVYSTESDTGFSEGEPSNKTNDQMQLQTAASAAELDRTQVFQSESSSKILDASSAFSPYISKVDHYDCTNNTGKHYDPDTSAAAEPSRYPGAVIALCSTDTEVRVHMEMGDAETRLQDTTDGLLRLLTHRLHRYISQALSILLTLHPVTSLDIAATFAPLGSYLHTTITTLHGWLTAGGRYVTTRELYRMMAKAVEGHVLDLSTVPQSAEARARVILRLTAYLMEVIEKADPEVDLGYLKNCWESSSLWLSLYSYPSWDLVALFEALNSMTVLTFPADCQTLYRLHCQLYCGLQQTRKCFTEGQLRRWVTTNLEYCRQAGRALKPDLPDEHSLSIDEIIAILIDNKLLCRVHEKQGLSPTGHPSSRCHSAEPKAKDVSKARDKRSWSSLPVSRRPSISGTERLSKSVGSLMWFSTERPSSNSKLWLKLEASEDFVKPEPGIITRKEKYYTLQDLADLNYGEDLSMNSSGDQGCLMQLHYYLERRVTRELVLSVLSVRALKDENMKLFMSKLPPDVSCDLDGSEKPSGSWFLW